MSWALLAAAGIVLALVIYAITGGADFGGGVWDLAASGPRAQAQRRLVAEALAPIWEANHVWLIAALVLLFLGFPAAFAAVSVSLHIPLTLFLLGIVFRGSAFVLRAYSARGESERRRFGRAFAWASLLSPVFLGIVVGSVASGRVRADAASADYLCWLAPFPIAVGALAACAFAHLAAVYLTLEAEDEPLREDFRIRALLSLLATGACALLAALLSRRGAPLLWQSFSGAPSSWVVFWAASAAAALEWTALRTRRLKQARNAAAALTALLVFGWALAQFPYVLPPDLTIKRAAAPASVLRPALLVGLVGALLLLPAFRALYAVFKGRQL